MKYSIIDDILYVKGQSTNIVCSEAEEEFWTRIQELEDCLAEIYHRTSCTTHQMELINKILPQE